MGRLGLGLYCLVGTQMGWSSFEERLLKGKLKYKIRLKELRWVKTCSKIQGLKVDGI